MVIRSRSRPLRLPDGAPAMVLAAAPAAASVPVRAVVTARATEVIPVAASDAKAAAVPAAAVAAPTTARSSAARTLLPRPACWRNPNRLIPKPRARTRLPVPSYCGQFSHRADQSLIFTQFLDCLMA